MFAVLRVLDDHTMKAYAYRTYKTVGNSIVQFETLHVGSSHKIFDVNDELVEKLYSRRRPYDGIHTHTHREFLRKVIRPDFSAQNVKGFKSKTFSNSHIPMLDTCTRGNG